MRNIKFFDSEEEMVVLPSDDFTDELTIAKYRYGYTDFYYDDTYDKTFVSSKTGFVNKADVSTIFLNSKEITEENIAQTITHESLHVVIWKFEENIGSEIIVRKILNEPPSVSSF